MWTVFRSKPDGAEAVPPRGGADGVEAVHPFGSSVSTLTPYPAKLIIRAHEIAHAAVVGSTYRAGDMQAAFYSAGSIPKERL